MGRHGAQLSSQQSAWHAGLALVMVLSLLGNATGLSVELPQPHLVGNPRVDSNGPSCSSNCALFIGYLSRPGALSRRLMIRTFIRRYISADIDMAFFISQQHSVPFKHAIELENATFHDVFLVNDPAAEMDHGEQNIPHRLHDQLVRTWNMFGPRYKFYASALENTILEPIVLKYKLLGLDAANATVYCPWSTEGGHCTPVFYAATGDVLEQIVEKKIQPQAGAEGLEFTRWAKQAVAPNNLTLCIPAPGRLVEGQAGRMHTLAIQHARTTDQWMTLINHVVWNLASWYECDKAQLQGEACAAHKHYVQALKGCTVPKPKEKPVEAKQQGRRRS